MIRFVVALGLVVLAALPVSAQTVQLVETETLSRTHTGLPPVAERVPEEPYIVDLAAKGRKVGKHGGDLKTMIGRSKDVRLINVWGYARLVGYDEQYQLKPDILRAVDEEEGRVFTLHLRKGHKWSNGEPFTSEDFRYWFEDILTNTELTPTPSPFMLVDGKLPTFEVVDETTVRFAWDKPNPNFLPSLAQARPPFIYRPAHYLKQFNPKYGDPEKIEEMVREAKVRSWAPLHNLKDEMYDASNPDLPSLQPWVLSAETNDRRAVMVRNPYFHRVTTEGQQLPYIDRVIMNVVDGGLIATKVQAGDADLQARGLVFADLPVLKRGEKSRGYTAGLWPQANASAIAIYPNLTVNDPELRTLFRDRRFREALSLGIDRELLNRVLYFGLGQPSANIVLPESPLYSEAVAAPPPYDTDKGNKLLDEIGLTKRNAEGIRLLPDGRPLELIIETAGEDAIQIDALELIKDGWRELGVALFPRPSQRDVMRSRAFSGDLAMSVWLGYDNGIPSETMPPVERVPTSEQFLTGPAWGAWVTSGGQSGEKPDYEPVVKLLEANNTWMTSENAAEREAAWMEILRIHGEEVLTLGTVQGVVQPVVISNSLKNVPMKATYGWDPGAQFGIYRPDEFFFADSE
ncbi:ABC transporter substrate-binding protein [Acuticoccus sediminis]|uniref:ABC transporter substrate-binding protein n=1 Tax=Acuticoccus sediminis TaxID=2184697 RepID=UPI001CFC621F|nr:ABC transporter substrate-binding protein [Acuticoccus sediminis]